MRCRMSRNLHSIKRMLVCLLVSKPDAKCCEHGQQFIHAHKKRICLTEQQISLNLQTRDGITCRFMCRMSPKLRQEVRSVTLNIRLRPSVKRDSLRRFPHKFLYKTPKPRFMGIRQTMQSFVLRRTPASHSIRTGGWGVPGLFTR
jgi:hypothetical protein